MSQFLNFAGNSGVTFKSFTASGGTTYTLDVASTTNSLMVSIGGVLQKPVTDYTVSGTTLTTTDTITSGIVIDTYVIHNAGGTAPVIEDNSVTTAKILNNNVTTAKILDNNVTGAKIAMGSDAAGDILYYNGTDYVRLGKGTTGHYLSQGGSNAPAWAAAGGGGLVFIQSQTASSAASIDFDGVLSSTYDQYLAISTDLHFDTNTVQCWIRTDSNGGDSFDAGAGNYNHINGGATYTSMVATRSGADTKIVAGGNMTGGAIGNDAATCAMLRLYINNPSGTVFNKVLNGTLSFPDDDDSGTGEHAVVQFTGVREATAAIDSFQILASSGTIDGTVRLYGTAFAEAAPKNLILRKIAKLEAQQTPRRLAEAILTDDGKTWLQSNRDLIAIEEAKL